MHIYNIYQINMIQFVIVFFAVIALFFLALLIAITCAGWFGLSSYIKRFVNKYISRSFDQEFRNIDRVPINSQCYICLQRIKCPVVASCNHSYCASCILQFIQSKRGAQIPCPACRQKVVVLFRQFEPDNEQQTKWKDQISDYNFKRSEQPGIIRSITELPNIVRNAPSLLSRDGVNFLLTNPRVKVILMLIVYTLSPIDFLPESFLGPLGLFDDSFAVANIFREVSGLMIAYNQQLSRNRGRNQERHAA